MVLFTEFIDTIIEDGYFDLLLSLLLGQSNQAAFIIGDEVLFSQLAIVAITLTTKVSKKEDIANDFIVACKF